MATVCRIFLIDDHVLLREGLAKILEEQGFFVCGQAEDATSALPLIHTLKPDLAIIDISLEGLNGLDLTKQLRAKLPRLRILVLSMHKEQLYAERALRAGANGYLMKQVTGNQLFEAVRTIMKGQTYVSPAMRDLMNQQIDTGGRPHDKISPVESLSNRELEVFQLIAKGYGTRQIADALHVSIKTVETHREHIREKLRVETTFELVQYALAWAQTGG
jgi:DNA-binding NarL/FixJ family response regulator